jgi:glycyl-tRNA synthetase alpha subunit
VLPALEHCLKCSHLFNMLDSSGSVGVTERTAYILRVRQLAVAICKRVRRGAPAAECEALTRVRRRRARGKSWTANC